ncbi:MAG: hypothetical protein MK080_01755 [Opitutales bacterium]|nr:hypothetical protein [Opitutales bacterium]
MAAKSSIEIVCFVEETLESLVYEESNIRIFRLDHLGIYVSGVRSVARMLSGVVKALVIDSRWTYSAFTGCLEVSFLLHHRGLSPTVSHFFEIETGYGLRGLSAVEVNALDAGCSLWTARILLDPALDYNLYGFRVEFEDSSEFCIPVQGVQCEDSQVIALGKIKESRYEMLEWSRYKGLVYIKKKPLEEHPRVESLLSLLDLDVDGKAGVAHKQESSRKPFWIIGNGPSVDPGVLDRLVGQPSMCFNRFHLCYSDTRFRPKYTVCADPQVAQDFGEEIHARAGGIVVFALQREHQDAVSRFATSLLLEVGYPPIFSKNPNQFVSGGGSSVYVGFQIALYLGVRKFYLYGFDFDFEYVQDFSGVRRDVQGDGNHFIESYRSGARWIPPEPKGIGAGMAGARALIEHEGGEIYNVSKGGYLHAFKRADISDALEKEGL